MAVGWGALAIQVNAANTERESSTDSSLYSSDEFFDSFLLSDSWQE